MKWIDRRLERFLHEPPSVRLAAATIVSLTLVVVVASGALMRVLDHAEYSSIWLGMWWALQTVTTVGYGDVAPKAPAGRLVGAVVMLEGIGFVAVVTAAVTSTFVARATRRQQEGEPGDVGRIEARFDELALRLDRIEAALGSRPAD